MAVAQEGVFAGHFNTMWQVPWQIWAQGALAAGVGTFNPPTRVDVWY